MHRIVVVALSLIAHLNILHSGVTSTATATAMATGVLAVVRVPHALPALFKIGMVEVALAFMPWEKGKQDERDVLYPMLYCTVPSTTSYAVVRTVYQLSLSSKSLPPGF